MPELQNARHELFAVLIAKGTEDSQMAAYRKAGYKPKSDEGAMVGASQLIRQVKVAARIAELQKLWAKEAGIETTDVLRGLAAIAFSDPRRAMSWGHRKARKGHKGKGDPFVEAIASGEIDDATAAAIKKFTITPSGAVLIELHDKAPALIKLGEHLGMFQGETAGGAPVNIDNRSVTYIEAPRNESVEDWQRRVASRGLGPKVLEHKP